jgi:predicted TPR repeat methyltransferase
MEVVNAENVAIGLKVVRGPNWIFGEKDGGEGSHGTISRFVKGSSDQRVFVKWEANGDQTNCRVGAGGKHDLCVAEIQPEPECPDEDESEMPVPPLQMPKSVPGGAWIVTFESLKTFYQEHEPSKLDDPRRLEHILSTWNHEELLSALARKYGAAPEPMLLSTSEANGESFGFGLEEHSIGMEEHNDLPQARPAPRAPAGQAPRRKERGKWSKAGASGGGEEGADMSAEEVEQLRGLCMRSLEEMVEDQEERAEWQSRAMDAAAPELLQLYRMLSGDKGSANGHAQARDGGEEGNTSGVPEITPTLLQEMLDLTSSSAAPPGHAAPDAARDYQRARHDIVASGWVLAVANAAKQATECRRQAATVGEQAKVLLLVKQQRRVAARRQGWQDPKEHDAEDAADVDPEAMLEEAHYFHAMATKALSVLLNTSSEPQCCEPMLQPVEGSYVSLELVSLAAQSLKAERELQQGREQPLGQDRGGEMSGARAELEVQQRAMVVLINLSVRPDTAAAMVEQLQGHERLGHDWLAGLLRAASDNTEWFRLWGNAGEAGQDLNDLLAASSSRLKYVLALASNIAGALMPMPVAPPWAWNGNRAGPSGGVGVHLVCGVANVCILLTHKLQLLWVTCVLGLGGASSRRSNSRGASERMRQRLGLPPGAEGPMAIHSTTLSIHSRLVTRLVGVGEMVALCLQCVEVITKAVGAARDSVAQTVATAAVWADAKLMRGLAHLAEEQPASSRGLGLSYDEEPVLHAIRQARQEYQPVRFAAVRLLLLSAFCVWRCSRKQTKGGFSPQRPQRSEEEQCQGETNGGAGVRELLARRRSPRTSTNSPVHVGQFQQHRQYHEQRYEHSRAFTDGIQPVSYGREDHEYAFADVGNDLEYEDPEAKVSLREDPFAGMQPPQQPPQMRAQALAEAMRLAEDGGAEGVMVCEADEDVAHELVTSLSTVDIESWFQHIGLGMCITAFGGVHGMDGKSLLEVWKANNGSPQSPGGWVEKLGAATLPVKLADGGSLKVCALDVVQREVSDLMISVATTAAKARVARESHLGGLVMAAAAAASSDGRGCWAQQERLLRQAVRLQPEVAGYRTSLATCLEQQHTIDSDDDSDLMSMSDADSVRDFGQNETGDRIQGNGSHPRLLSTGSSRSLTSNFSIGSSNGGRRRDRGLGAVVTELERAAAIADSRVAEGMAAGTDVAAAVSVWLKLAEVQRKRAEVQKSAQAYLRALQLIDVQSSSGDGGVGKTKAKVLLKLAKLYAQFASQQGNFRDMMSVARGYCRRALEADATNTIARYWLAAYSSGGLADADGSAQQPREAAGTAVPIPYDEADLDDRSARRMSGMRLSPPVLIPVSAPPDYVRKLFDHYSTAVDVHDEGKGRRRTSKFDQAMVGDGGGANLSYSAHRKLLRLMRKSFVLAKPKPDTFAHSIDLGCGTGLAGQLFRRKLSIKRMTGVDISAGMLRWAAAKTVNGGGRKDGGIVYDSVLEGDVCEVLRRDGAPLYDLVIVCDTIPYIGGLDTILLAIHESTAPGAVVALTTELMPDSAVRADKQRGYMLQSNGRYNHHHRYVTRGAVEAGFTVLESKSAPIRNDGPHEVMGLMVVLQRA